MTSTARHTPVLRTTPLAFAAAVLLLPVTAFAQQPYGQPYPDPYRSGPTRPLDGSPRKGVYSAQPAPSYETPRRDLGGGQPLYEPPAIWRGFYFGAQAGHRWTNASASGSSLPAITTKGAQAGGFVGTNFVSGPVVLGLEADLMVGSSSASTASAGTTLSMKDTWTSTFRARAGYAFGPTLLYGTAGVVLAGQDIALKSGTISSAMTDARVGLAWGAGIEMKVAPQASVRLEGLHYSYRDAVLNTGTGPQSVKQDSTTIRAGVAFQFN
jgi:outer membrane immunogenic protein